MSHFAVLVVGDVDHNMAPFHEFECDGRDDEFIQDIDKTEEYRSDFEKAKARYAKEVAEGADAQTTRYSFKGSTFREYLTDYCGLKSLEIGEELDLKEKHKFGYAKHLGGDDFQVIDRTNPTTTAAATAPSSSSARKTFASMKLTKPTSTSTGCSRKPRGRLANSTARSSPRWATRKASTPR